LGLAGVQTADALVGSLCGCARVDVLLLPFDLLCLELFAAGAFFWKFWVGGDELSGVVGGVGAAAGVLLDFAEPNNENLDALATGADVVFTSSGAISTSSTAGDLLKMLNREDLDFDG
jgi:hypothetical protein